MKHIRQHLIFLLTLAILLTLIGFVVVADAELPFIVRTIYFQPTNAPAPTDRIAELMIEVQDFYRTEMERNDYGDKTFRLETDNDGDVVVHTVKGRNNIAHYSATTSASITQELPVELKNNNNIHVIIVAGLRLVNNRVWGVGWPVYGAASGGYAVISTKSGHFGKSVIAHELGHAFGLYHNIRDGNFLMGPGSKALDTYEARWLDKHHYFNDVHNINHVPDFRIIQRIREVEKDVLRFQIEVDSINGLHQAQIFRHSDVAILGWQPLDGNTDTAEFHIRRNILDNQKHVSVQVLDTQGNHNIARISVRHLPYHIPREKNPILEPEIVIDINKDQGKQPPKLGVSVTHKRIMSWAKLKLK